MRLRPHTEVCPRTNCPTVFETDQPGQVAVQGIELVDAEARAELGDLPDHETVVLVPRKLLIEYATLARGVLHE